MLRWLPYFACSICTIGVLLVGSRFVEFKRPVARGATSGPGPWLRIAIVEPEEPWSAAAEFVQLLAEIDSLPVEERQVRVVDWWESWGPKEAGEIAGCLRLLVDRGRESVPVLAGLVLNDICFDRQSALVLGVLDAIRALGPGAIVDLARLHDAESFRTCRPSPAGALLSRVAPTASGALFELARTGGDEERRIALRGLGYCTDRETFVQACETALGDPCVEVRGWAAFLLVGCERGGDGEERARQLVLEDPEPSVRMHAAFSGLRIHSPPPLEFIPCYLAALEAEDAFTREFGAWYLNELTGDEKDTREVALKAVVACLESEKVELRVPAARFLGRVRDRPMEVLEALDRHLDDPDARVAQLCREALGE